MDACTGLIDCPCADCVDANRQADEIERQIALQEDDDGVAVAVPMDWEDDGEGVEPWAVDQRDVMEDNFVAQTERAIGAAADSVYEDEIRSSGLPRRVVERAGAVAYRGPPDGGFGGFAHQLPQSYRYEYDRPGTKKNYKDWKQRQFPGSK